MALVEKPKEPLGLSRRLGFSTESSSGQAATFCTFLCQNPRNMYIPIIPVKEARTGLLRGLRAFPGSPRNSQKDCQEDQGILKQL